MQVTTLGIDLAKNVFCLHGCDANGKAVLRKQLSRRHCRACFKKRYGSKIARRTARTKHNN